MEKTRTSNSFKTPSFQTVVFKQQQQPKNPNQTKLLTEALTREDAS